MRARAAPIAPLRTRWTASTAAHRTSRLPCLVIRPRWALVSDSRWRGVTPAHEHSCCGQAKRVTSPISATNTAARDRADPVDGLHRAVSRVGRQLRGDSPPHGVDLERERLDQPAQRRNPPGVGRVQAQLVEQALPGGAEQVTHRHPHALLREHRVDLGLEPRAQRDELGPVPDLLAELPGGRRGDPRLGQPAHPQQISKISGVAFVVLDPSVGEAFHPQRVGQVDQGALGV